MSAGLLHPERVRRGAQNIAVVRLDSTSTQEQVTARRDDDSEQPSSVRNQAANVEGTPRHGGTRVCKAVAFARASVRRRSRE